MFYFKLLHKYRLDDHFETKEIGIYSSPDLAAAAIEQLTCKPGFADHPEAFQIKKCFRPLKPKLLDRTFWTDGFDTYTAAKYYRPTAQKTAPFRVMNTTEVKIHTEEMIQQKFNELDTMIEAYHQMTDRDGSAKFDYFLKCLDFVSSLEEEGLLIKPIKHRKHPISYLKSILENDGPEYALVIPFHNCFGSHYEIGVCVRGEPSLRKLPPQKKRSWFRR